MGAFSLSKSGKVFEFELNGEVKKNGAIIGKWSTSNDDNNHLIVTEDNGTVTSFPVIWKFNKHNQLELIKDDTILVNFHSQTGSLPLYRIVDEWLHIKPDRSKSFEFFLNPDWNLNENLNLTVTFGTVSSTIDGYIEDDRSRFIYKFFPKKGDIEIFQLVFAGLWSGKLEDGKYLMTFNYKRKGQERAFTLPDSVTFDKSINQIVFDYEKHGLRRRLQFAGELKISPKFVISYKLDRQQSGAGKDLVASTTIVIQAKLDMDRFKSKLDMTFVLMKSDGTTPGTKLIIGGTFERDLSGSKLKLGFVYKYEKTGGVVKTNSFTLSGQFKLRNDLTLIWEFSHDVATRSTTVAFAAENFRLGDFTGNLQLSVSTADGRLKEIHMIFGISF